jgi:hypothetical protein
MALTWGTLVAGGFVVFGVPTAVILLNRRKRNAGWWLLAAFVALIIVGNLAEKATRGSSPLF